MLIGEVSQHAGISTRMLRHYDAVGLVSPSGRTAGGYRDYSADDVQRLFHVESLRTLGIPLGDLRRALDDPGFAPSDLLQDLIANTRHRLTREEELLGHLLDIDAGEPATWVDVLHTVALMRDLASDDPSQRQQSVLSVDRESAVPARIVAAALLEEEDTNVAGALRWALRRAQGGSLSILEPALRSPEPEVARRAVQAIAEIETDEASALLATALDHADEAVHGHAALALGTRYRIDSIPALVQMIVRGTRDVDAAETLGGLARRHDIVDFVAHTIANELDASDRDPQARHRLVQSLAELPGPASRSALESVVAGTDARAALTEAHVLTLQS